MSTRERASLIPNANNPRLLLRVLSMVAAGIRRPRALAEYSRSRIRTVHYYTQACEWLGLLSFDTEVHLTERGMELAFAEPHKQMELYGQAVWSNGFAQGLLQGRTEMPDQTPSQPISCNANPRCLRSLHAVERVRSSVCSNLLLDIVRFKWKTKDSSCHCHSWHR